MEHARFTARRPCAGCAALKNKASHAIRLRLLAYAYENMEDGSPAEPTRSWSAWTFIRPVRDIKDLIRKGIVRLTKPKGRVYEVITEPERFTTEIPPEFARLQPVLEQKGFVKNSDIQKVLGVSPVQARLIARRLVWEGWLEPIGEKRGRRYVQSQRVIKPSQQVIQPSP
jgi:hypothetical protein